MKTAVWILAVALVAGQLAAQTNVPIVNTVPAPMAVPTPPQPYLSVPGPIAPAPFVPTPNIPYAPITNARPFRPRAPILAPNSQEITTQFLQAPPIPPTAAQIAATQTVVRVVEEPLPVMLVTNRFLYVEPNGNDEEADGSVAAPFRTIQRAANTAEPGDTVIVRPGVYEGFRTRRGGTNGCPITFQARGNVLILDSKNIPPDHILVRGTDWIVIDGFTLRQAKRSGIGVIESSDVVIKNNVCATNQVWGIFSGFAPRIQVLNNKAFGCREQHGIYISNSRVPDDNPVIRGNECFENAGSGIQLNGDCNMGGDGYINGALVENNIIHHNGIKGFSLASIQGSLIQNNLLYNNGLLAGAGGIHLSDEPGCEKPSCDNIVVNNTIAEPSIAPIRFSDGATRNFVFNNIIFGRRGIVDEAGGNEIDTESNLRSDMAMDFFANADAFDFRLRPGTPARDAGRLQYLGKNAPTNDITGFRRSFTIPCIGAYELTPFIPMGSSR